MMEQRLTVEGKMAERFLKRGVGTKVKLTVNAKMMEAGLMPDYSEPMNPGEGHKKMRKMIPRVTLHIIDMSENE